jgi:putative ABC transport system substrate-binding protein
MSFDRLTRRELVALLGAAAAWPPGVFAQEAGRTYRIAYLGPSPRTAPPQSAFFEALDKLGFVAGKNLEIDVRGFARRPEEFAQAAEELVRAMPDLILCGGPESGRAAQQATKMIPLLVNTDDMVGEDLVASIAHPGGNTTGISIRSSSLDGKRFEILLELIEGARRIDALAGSDTGTEQHFQELREAAQARGLQLVIHVIKAYGEIAPAIEAAKSAGAAGLNVLGSALLFGNRQVIIERAAALALPAVYQWPENAHEGGLIAYGPSIVRIYREQMSRLAVKILRGTKPTDLPVEQPDKFDLAINLKTAKALGLSVSQAILAQADDIVE